MSDINPNQYQGASVVLVGYASGPAQPPAYDKEGTKGVLELRIPIGEGYKKDGVWVDTSTTWYSYSAAGEHADKLRAVQKGDKVRIDDAKQEVREYTDREGKVQKGITLKFGTLTILEASGSKSGNGGFVPESTAGGF